MPQAILGIDIGSYSIKAALIESSYKRQTVRALREYHLTNRAQPMPDVEELKEVARSIAEDPRARGAVVVLGLPDFVVFKKALRFPFDDRKKIDEAIGFPFSEAVPVAFQDVVIDYQFVGRDKDGHDLFTLAVRRDLLRGVIDAFREAGLDPRVVTAGGLSYLNLQGVLEPQGPGGCQAFVDLGYHSVRVLVVKDGVPRLLHTVLTGGARVADAVGKALHLTAAEAQELVKDQAELVPEGREAPGEAGLVQKALREQVDAVLHEVFRVLHAHQVKTSDSPARVWLGGGLSEVCGVVDRAEVALGVPCALLQPELDWGPEVPPGSLRRVGLQALALALTPSTRRWGAEVNFRKGEFEYQGAYQFLKGKIGVLATFLGIFVALLAVKTWFDYRVVSDQYAAMLADLGKLTERYLGEEIDDFDTALRQIQKGEGQDLGQLIPKEDVFDAFLGISGVIDQMNDRTAAELNLAGFLGAGGGQGGPVGPPGGGPIGPPGGAGKPEGMHAEGGMLGDPLEGPGGPSTELGAGPSAGLGAGGPEEEKVYVELYEIDLDRKGLRMRAETSSVDAMEYFLAKMKGVPCLHHVLLENSDQISFQRHAGWRRFTVSAQYDCGRKKEKEGEAKGKEKDKGKELDKEPAAGGKGQEPPAPNEVGPPPGSPPPVPLPGEEMP